ncbi:MAG: 6-phosphogluconolactonase [Acidimicrobiales bacterium]
MFYELRSFDDHASLARAGARFVVEAAHLAVNSKGRFDLAVSGGTAPREMFEVFAASPMPWAQTVIYQVDERVVGAEDSRRNLRMLRETLPDAAVIHPMPVDGPDLEEAADEYAASLPRWFDLVHLGLGPDGHTASLVPGDAVLNVTDRDVAITGEYQGDRRMTLTYRGLAKARQLIWVVLGTEKRRALDMLVRGDRSIPAGRVEATSSIIFADVTSAS